MSQTSNCSLLLIYRPRKDERLSQPRWLTYSGRFTRISGQALIVGRLSRAGQGKFAGRRPAFYRCCATQPTEVSATRLLHYHRRLFRSGRVFNSFQSLTLPGHRQQLAPPCRQFLRAASLYSCCLRASLEITALPRVSASSALSCTSCTSLSVTEFVDHHLQMLFDQINQLVDHLECRGNYSAKSTNMKLVHWPLMGGLLHLVQRRGDWVGPQPAHAHPRCTKCNSPPINGQWTNHRIVV